MFSWPTAHRLYAIRLAPALLRCCRCCRWFRISRDTSTKPLHHASDITVPPHDHTLWLSCLKSNHDVGQRHRAHVQDAPDIPRDVREAHFGHGLPSSKLRMDVPHDVADPAGRIAALDDIARGIYFGCVRFPPLHVDIPARRPVRLQFNLSKVRHVINID